MRIAFSGTHRSGKSTLLEQVAELLPGYETVDEPYYLLEEQGYEMAEVPSLEDFEAQLEQSLTAIDDGDDNVLFDRCPADVLAYLTTHEDADSFDIDVWQERVTGAMKTIDVVVFVPVEANDRIAVGSHENREQRMAVHHKLEELLVDDALGWDIDVLQVEGDMSSRVRQVMSRIASTTAARSPAPGRSRGRRS